MDTESCSNCRFSVEEWRFDNVDENDAELMGLLTGPGAATHERNLFHCRRYPPTINLMGYTIKFVEPDQHKIDIGIPDSGGALIQDDRQWLGNFPLTRPDYWCGEWSSR